MVKKDIAACEVSFSEKIPDFAGKGYVDENQVLIRKGGKRVDVSIIAENDHSKSERTLISVDPVETLAGFDPEEFDEILTVKFDRLFIVVADAVACTSLIS